VYGFPSLCFLPNSLWRVVLVPFVLNPWMVDDHEVLFKVKLLSFCACSLSLTWSTTIELNVVSLFGSGWLYHFTSTSYFFLHPLSIRIKIFLSFLKFMNDYTCDFCDQCVHSILVKYLLKIIINIISCMSIKFLIP